MTPTTTEQIKRLIERTERAVAVRTFKMSCFGWGLTVVSTSALWGVGQGELAIIAGMLQLLPAAQISRNAFHAWREFKRAPAWRLWRELIQRPGLLSASSQDLANSLQDLYRYDTRGDMLPVFQATRLLLIYDVQQRRLATLGQQGVALRSVREQLLEKSERLQQLGDSSPSIGASADEITEEIGALDQLRTDIQASCYRMEAIVLSAHQAVQVKQLHQEIAQLKSSISPSRNAGVELATPEITDIERQIGREIETFLQLERETESHLRDL